MSREEAINILNDYDINFERHTAEEVAEAHEMAIEALKAQPCEDCISKKAALDGLASIAKAKAKSDSQKSLMGRVMFFTEHLPSVTPQPKAEGVRGGIPLQQSVPKMPQPNECEYCHEDSDGYVKPLEKNCHAYIRFGMQGWVIELKAKGWRGKAPIKFCPMCGRRLTNG